MVFEIATEEKPLCLVEDLDRFTCEKLVSLLVEKDAQVFLKSINMKQKFLIKA